MDLSEKQKEIVETKERFVVVNASAASGKTATLTERVKYLLNNNIDPKKIVVITFTNAAADEMKERIGDTNGAFIGTIHSYANYLLKCCGYDTESYLKKLKNIKNVLNLSSIFFLMRARILQNSNLNFYLKW